MPDDDGMVSNASTSVGVEITQILRQTTSMSSSEGFLNKPLPVPTMVEEMIEVSERSHAVSALLGITSLFLEHTLPMSNLQ